MNTFRQDLDEAVAYHGHLCSGQLIGVRMARMGLRLLGIEDPKAFRDLVVYVECDGCLTDAIGTVTGCKLGKRNLKWIDYGKSAATFLNSKTGEAVRVFTATRMRPPEDADLIEFFEAITDDELFRHKRVTVRYRPEDLPGKPLAAIVCQKCGDEVIDGRHVIRGGVPMCKACADGAYYDVTG